MSKKIRAILMDMDGTALGKSQVAISMENMKAVQEAIARGIHVIPCTGRVYDRDTGESLYEDLIPVEESARLMEFLEGKGLYNEIAANGTIYLEKAITQPLNMALVPEHHVWYVRDNCFTAVEKPSAYFREHGVAVEKMNIYGIPEGLQQEVYDFVTATGFVGHTRPGAGPNLEFLHRGLDKLRAVEVILGKLGVSYEETLAIGDSSSDLAIIKACGIGVAMGNAPEQIKAAADYVTDLNTANGLAKALRKFVL